MLAPLTVSPRRPIRLKTTAPVLSVICMLTWAFVDVPAALGGQDELEELGLGDVQRVLILEFRCRQRAADERLLDRGRQAEVGRPVE